MYQEKERSSREKYDAGGYHRSREWTLVAATGGILGCAERYSLDRSQTYTANVDGELTSASHSSLGLGLSHRTQSLASAGDHDDIMDFHVLENFKLHFLGQLRIGGRHRPTETQ